MTRRYLPTLLALALTACSSDSTVTTTTAPPAPSNTGATVDDAPTADPYQVYLTLPGADTSISAEDAQLRAMLGCRLTYAPGTVDHAIQEAYAGLVEQWRTQGLCG